MASATPGTCLKVLQQRFGHGLDRHQLVALLLGAELGQALQDQLLDLGAEAFQLLDLPGLGRGLQVLRSGDPQFLVEDMDPLGPQAGHVHQERQGRGGAGLQLFEQAQVAGLDDFPDLARQVLTHPGQFG